MRPSWLVQRGAYARDSGGRSLGQFADQRLDLFAGQRIGREPDLRRIGDEAGIVQLFCPLFDK